MEHYETSLKSTGVLRSLKNQACVIKKENFSLKLKNHMPLEESLNGLASLVLAKTFSVSLENLCTSVKIKPNCLVICRPGETYHSNFNFEKEPGIT